MGPNSSANQNVHCSAIACPRTNLAQGIDTRFANKWRLRLENFLGLSLLDIARA
jgi:hypothetical protein